MSDKVRIPVWDGTEPCSNYEWQLFYDDNRSTEYKQKKKLEKLVSICMSCHRLEECSDYAIKHERYGFWAGMTEKQRIDYRKRNNIVCVRPELLSDYLPDFRTEQ